jgi:hypothetical protein
MLEVKTEAGIILDKNNESLLDGGAVPGEQIIVTLLPLKSTLEATRQPTPRIIPTNSNTVVPKVYMPQQSVPYMQPARIM